ncbi:hypothetical protein [Arsenicibacter rosenii]|uniref:Carboxypeptidase regulatory-like domain-containing protein n=1 Tax=Arsenicibacter rosenii TaxID=1750698 RepID=A0A1S2VCN3_9BACT|nr:hypothetical protein [Arsenicibacter rosenii]OIN56180.1 hypothetical protein BLX24_26260 [Arsenicibacter rosenii]
MHNTCPSRWACNLSAWLILLGLLAGLAWTASAQTTAKPTRKPLQGICGTVTELTGNQMPRITEDGKDPKTGNGKRVVRDVLIYPVLTIQQAPANSEGFIDSVPGIKPVKTIKSDGSGTFCAYGLAPGLYSLLVREPKGLYANQFDDKNRIFPVRVTKRKVTQTEITISHQAAF